MHLLYWLDIRNPQTLKSKLLQTLKLAIGEGTKMVEVDLAGVLNPRGPLPYAVPDVHTASSYASFRL